MFTFILYNDLIMYLECNGTVFIAFSEPFPPEKHICMRDYCNKKKVQSIINMYVDILIIIVDFSSFQIIYNLFHLV